MKEKKYQLTDEGLRNLKDEHERLKRVRQAIIGGRDDTPEALHSEDLNQEFVHFRDNLSRIDARIAELDDVFRHFKQIKPKKGVVGIGTVVTVNVDGEDDQFSIVDAIEANPSMGKISVDSPVGKALFGKKEGDEILIPSPVRTVYKIKKIDYFES